MAFSRSHRIKKDTDFRDFSRIRPGASNAYLSIKTKPATGGQRQIAVVVPARVAPEAHVRNRLRRRVSEALRLLIPRLRPGHQIVCTVRLIVLPTTDELKKDLLFLLQKSDMLDQ